MINFDTTRKFHANAIRAGLPVLDWDQFESLARDIIAAECDLRDVIREVSEFIDELVGEARSYPAWEREARPEAVEAYELLKSDSVPTVGPDCFQFRLTDGKAKRNPLKKMTGKLTDLRKATTRIRTTLAHLKSKAND